MVAGLNISNAICNLLNVVFVAMGNAVGILIGQYLGASKFEEAKKYSMKLMWFTGVMCLLLTGILILCAKGFPELYDTTPEVKDLGRWFIVITALFFPLQGFLNVLFHIAISRKDSDYVSVRQRIFLGDSGAAGVCAVFLYTTSCAGSLCYYSEYGYDQGDCRLYSGKEGSLDHQFG